MNRKIFALLLLLPVAVMATDKLTHESDEGGDRQKKKTEASNSNGNHTTAVNPNNEAAPDKAALQDVPVSTTVQATEKKQHESAKPSANPLVLEEMKQMIAASLDPMSPYAEYKGHVYLNDESVSAEVRDFIKTKVEERLESANPVSIDLDRSFSRCPSGYHVVLVSNDQGGLTNEGWMVVDDGCWDRPVAKFRYDMQANTVEGYVGEKTGYLALDTFFRVYKMAAKVEG